MGLKAGVDIWLADERWVDFKFLIDKNIVFLLCLSKKPSISIILVLATNAFQLAFSHVKLVVRYVYLEVYTYVKN